MIGIGEVCGCEERRGSHPFGHGERCEDTQQLPTVFTVDGPRTDWGVKTLLRKIVKRELIIATRPQMWLYPPPQRQAARSDFDVHYLDDADAGAKKLVMRDCRVPSLVRSVEERLTMQSHRCRVEAEPERRQASERWQKC